jgi:hypothetical protein
MIMITLHLSGEPIRVLHVNRETGQSLIAFKNKTQYLPTSQLLLIADPEPEALAQLLLGHNNQPDSDQDKLVIFPGVGLVAKGSILSHMAPMTVGNLCKKAEERGK